MTIDPLDVIDFSAIENDSPSLLDLTNFANSLPSVMDDSTLEALSNTLQSTSPAPAPAPAVLELNASSDRVTIRLSIDVSRAFREAAARRGVGYQTLINDVLRTAIPGL